jgi:glycosyltransferase involved in cell wall biosynthesis
LGYYNKIKELINKLGLSQEVELLGKVSDERILHEYKTNDIFVFASHMQSCGLSVFEAQASGLPVIVSKTSGSSELLTDHENCIIVEPKSPEAIAAAVKELIDQPELYERIANAGRRFVEENVSWSRYTDEMLDFFKSASQL